MNCYVQDTYAPLFDDAFEVIHHHHHHYPQEIQQIPQTDTGHQYLPVYSNFQHHLEAMPESYYPVDLPSQRFLEPIVLNGGPNAMVCENLMQNSNRFPENHFPDFFTPRQGKGRKRLRLYEFLNESLHNSEMADCIQWVDRNNGVFQFISKNKEKLAELWGRRKGNRKTMTYQKMARALRNYSGTGEIVKIRRKLTYQFDAKVLQRLVCNRNGETGFYQHFHREREHFGCDNWHLSYPCNDIFT
ncbi:transcription factor Spi-C isoform X2 [Callorhinchus milii]|nr:transcription factor Spi-C isoform X2 [Callorhinchus milii]